MSAFQTLLINMDRSKDRLEKMSTELAAADISFERLSAVDGSVAIDRTDTGYDSARAKKVYGRPLLAGEVGCYLSHLQAAKIAAETEHEFTLVVEDDAAIPHDLAVILADIIKLLPKDIGLVNLARPAKHRFSTVSLEIGLVRAHYYPVTTTAILWRRSHAAQLLQSDNLLCHPVDVFLQEWAIENDCGGAFLNPPIQPDGAESAIYSGKRGKEDRSRSYKALHLQRLLKNHVLAWKHKRAQTT